MSLSPPRSSSGAFAMQHAESDPDLTPDDDILTQTYAFNRNANARSRKEPGPATYSPTSSFTLRRAPRATIGTEERFSSNFAGMFFRAEAASELQCRDSPGPKYRPGTSNLPRAPTVSWGAKPSPDQVKRKLYDWASRDSPLGPAAYNPRADKILPSPARVRFGKADRFSSFGNAYALNNSPLTSDGPSSRVTPMDVVRPKSSAFSFGGGRTHPPRANDPEARSRPRTAFLTHSIRGGLAKPATLECGVGPADFDTDHLSIARTMQRPRGHRNGFGSAPRFVRPGLVFVSSEHAKADGTISSPGPKYAYSNYSVTVKPRQVGALHWTP